MSAPVILQNFAKFYNANFDRRPVPTLMVTNGILNTIADAVAQSSQMILAQRSMPHPDTPEFQPPPPGYDYARTLRFAVFGVAMGPLIGVWMRFLERNIPLVGGSRRRTLQLGKRVFADQVLLAPIGLAIFVSAMGAMEGKNTEQLKEKFSDMYLPALISNWKVWPLAQAVNFSLMPLQYRVPFQSTCGIAWNVYLSLLNAR
ncbi:hypothetical protein QFC20_003629 [Naganishia adeliensis]|uniref:Uncharacterized protein n=1 Tax=Naganishia adeliensis TaxID=92952 RepID=A0ACC2WAD4_9TREE|nr:hypothetical protein QFC20_003629 [Naganishia adeliensis]